MSHFFACGRWHVLIRFQYHVLWADPAALQVQPRAQITRDMHGDEVGPKSSQEISLQIGACVKRVHGKAQARLSWRLALSPAQLGQGLKNPGWAYIEPLDPWAGRGERPQVSLVRAIKACCVLRALRAQKTGGWWRKSLLTNYCCHPWRNSVKASSYIVAI